MTDLLGIPFPELKTFFLVLIRISIILFMLPVFNARVLPGLAKAGLAFIISLILLPVLRNSIGPFPETMVGIVHLVLAELIIGLILGLVVRTFFEAVRMMGHLVGFQTGFAITNVIDPQSGQRVSIFSNMADFMALILFLLLNGHHILLSAIKESFEVLPMGELDLKIGMLNRMIPILGSIFVIALKIGAPAIVALLCTKVAFGLITRFIPQMNIMIVAFPVQIVVGLIFFGICLNLVVGYMGRYLEDLHPLLINMMAGMKV